MGSVQALDWLFSTPETFLFFMSFITMIGTFAATRQLRTSILVAVLTLVYGSYSGNEYFTGLMYLLLVSIALLTANQLYGFIIGGGDDMDGI